MRSIALIHRISNFLVFASILAASGILAAQEHEGETDLDEAFNQKINAKSTRDLDKVASLCESAIEKGLDEEGIQQAQELWSSALYEHADQLSKRIFGPQGPDRRWRVYRREALSRLKKSVELTPGLGEGHLLIARLSAMEGGDRDLARSSVEKAVELAADDQQQLSQALFIRATLAEDDETRLADLNQAIKINPENVDAVRVRGILYLNLDEPEKAVKDFRKWLAEDSDNLGAHYVVIRALIRLDKYDEAAEFLDKAIEIDPDRSQSYTMRAQLHLQQDKIDEALSDTNKAIKLNGRDFEARLLRASILLEREEYDDALDDVNRVLQVEPRSVQGIWIRGIILASKREFTEAIDDVKKLVASYPRDSRYRLQLAMLYNADDQPSKAIKIYDRWIEDHPATDWEDIEGEFKEILMARRAGALRGRGDARLSLGQHEQAIKDYDKALVIRPEDDGVLNNLAWVLATSPEDELRDGERAIELALKACEITDYKEAHILSTLASGYAEQGDFETAKKWAAKAVEISDDPEQMENLKKELASYEESKPWREKQNVEAEKKEKEKEAQGEDKESEENKDDEDKDGADKEPGSDENKKDDDPDGNNDQNPDDEKSSDKQGDGHQPEGKRGSN